MNETNVFFIRAMHESFTSVLDRGKFGKFQKRTPVDILLTAPGGLTYAAARRPRAVQQCSGLNAKAYVDDQEPIHGRRQRQSWDTRRPQKLRRIVWTVLCVPERLRIADEITVSPAVVCARTERVAIASEFRPRPLSHAEPTQAEMSSFPCDPRQSEKNLVRGQKYGTITCSRLERYLLTTQHVHVNEAVLRFDMKRYGVRRAVVLFRVKNISGFYRFLFEHKHKFASKYFSFYKRDIPITFGFTALCLQLWTPQIDDGPDPLFKARSVRSRAGGAFRRVGIGETMPCLVPAHRNALCHVDTV